MMKKEKELLVAVASQKGGVGKSVFTVLLASVLHYRKGLRVAVVDCDYPQHSIALMRERDMESVMKNDDLKVSLYRQHERIRKLAYPVIKSDPEKAVEDLRRYMDEKGETFDIYNPQIQISAESETKRSIFREKDKTKRSKKESAQHSKSRNKSFVMTSVSAL